MKELFTLPMAQELCGMVHGSGLDTDPYIEEGRKHVFIHWDYHLMGDGYYCGYWRFTVKIPKDDPREFKITGRRGNMRSSAAFGLLEYLYEVFSNGLDEVLGKAGINAKSESRKIYPGDPGFNPDIPIVKELGYHYGGFHWTYTRSEPCTVSV